MSSPRFGEQRDEDPSVCYRHPDRQSWILCQRCGRTICAECQILAPVGVQCPECVREAGGSVQWTPTNTKPVKQRAAARRQPTPRSREQAGFQGYITGLLRPGGELPSLSWIFAGIVVVLWLVGLFTTSPSAPVGLPFAWFAASPLDAAQLWRYATSAFVTPAIFSLGGVLSLALSLFFWLLFAPSVERSFGRTRFLTVFFAATIIGAAAQVMAQQYAFGLAAGLFGLFGSYAVLMWSYPQMRMQIIVVIAINLAINLFLGGGALWAIVGGLLAGAGTTYLLQYYSDRPRSRRATPYLIVGGVVVAAVTAAIITSSAYV